MKRRNFLKASMGTLYMMASPNMAFPDVKLSDKKMLVAVKGSNIKSMDQG